MTFGSGQTSGVWTRRGDIYVKVVDGSIVELREIDGAVEARATGEISESRVREVVSRAVTPDYPWAEFQELAEGSGRLRDALRECRGLRLSCSVEPFEGLICSVLSQNTSVERWRTVATELSRHLGESVDGLYGFPSADVLAAASEDEVRECGAGYRAPYVLDAARWARDGGLERVRDLPVGEARAELLSVKGIGEKVADCVLLYGLCRFEAAPIDVHMMRRLCDRNYDTCRDTLRDEFGGHAGLAQLYLYDHERRA